MLKRKHGKMKRFASLLVALILMLGNISAATVHAEETSSFAVTVSKTLQAVEGKENYFDITLQAVSDKFVSESTDVVVVLDISNTMNSDAHGVESAPVANKKITMAKNALKDFALDFATDTELDDNRKLAIVTYNRDAQVVVGLTEANDKADYNSYFEDAISGITAPTDNKIKWRNIQGGLQLAANILADSTAEYKHIILLTCGLPTTYLKDPNSTSKTVLEGYNPIMSGSYGKTKAETVNNGEGELGYFANTRTKRPANRR